MQTCTLKTPFRRSVVGSIPIREGQHIEIDLDLDDATIEIRHIEPCGITSGSVFVDIYRVDALISLLRRAARKSGGRVQ